MVEEESGNKKDDCRPNIKKKHWFVHDSRKEDEGEDNINVVMCYVTIFTWTSTFQDKW